MFKSMTESMLEDKQDMMVEVMCEYSKGKPIKDDTELAVLFMHIYDTKLPSIAKVMMKPEDFIKECMCKGEFFKKEVNKKIMKERMKLV